MLMAEETKEKFNKSYSIIVWFSMCGPANWISNNNPRVWFDKNVISALRYSLNYISCIYNAFIREMNIIPIYGICKSNKNNKLNRILEAKSYFATANEEREKKTKVLWNLWLFRTNNNYLWLSVVAIVLSYNRIAKNLCERIKIK